MRVRGAPCRVFWKKPANPFAVLTSTTAVSARPESGVKDAPGSTELKWIKPGYKAANVTRRLGASANVSRRRP
jgi:hypothetical protein